VSGLVVQEAADRPARAPVAVTPDIDDTCDVGHGNQQLALFNAHCDERCLLPIHAYDTARARPVVVLLRPGKTPTREEIRGHLRRLVRRFRQHWPGTRLTIPGDSHYGRSEVMVWCEANDPDYIFGLPGNAVPDRLVEPIADEGLVPSLPVASKLLEDPQDRSAVAVCTQCKTGTRREADNTEQGRNSTAGNRQPAIRAKPHARIDR
jgi:hypothetical protein